MPAFTASAPGKAILFGEHAVVYHRPAIAIPVQQVQARVVVQAEPRYQAGQVHIQSLDINLDAWLHELPASHPIAAAIAQVLGALGIARLPACTVRIVSTIPVAAGLGSGAAVSVALMRALAAFLGHTLSDVQVCALAFEIEKLHHGNPSGVDNTVIAYNQPVFYRREQPVQTFRVQQPFTLVIGDTGQPSPTAITVGDVRRAWQADQARYEAIFDQIGQISEQARQAIETGQITRLGPLLDTNQELLVQLGVSSPELERLIGAARSAGALGAKLCGGGRGGNMLALVSPANSETVASALSKAGAVRVITTTVQPGP